MVRISPISAAPFHTIFDNVQMLGVEVSPNNDGFKVKVSFYWVVRYFKCLQQDAVREAKRKVI